ncbi:hypothetical protein P154DRAFT_541052 [Amniculicola lignicola CBS 123094]|uniref:Uncharacterized protein n=1 Tax=Amniculicola lignicola CBS 123094 TaxID=1392246 RepID=A0A6A5X441_9PLEO|nr:hypothetical protein P154DRAFT_541052 [Amniculicola lignicola CBS 123094]
MHSDSRALKIEYFQHVYKLYSHLQFTKYGDRPFAVAGLEKRLLAAFDTQGGFGIFDDGDSAEGGLFHWSLLWQRADENMNLKLIDFSECGIRAPSWSWMAHRGGIEYTDPPYQSAIWEKNGIHPPWSCGGMASLDSYHRDGEVPLTDTVRDFTVRGRKENEVKLSEMVYCILLAALVEMKPRRGGNAYTRVGAGTMLGKFISLDSWGISGKIY